MSFRQNPSLKRGMIPAAALATLSLTAWAVEPTRSDSTWPQWRGVSQDGVAIAGEYPMRWSEASVAFKAPVAGLGGSTPVVAGDRAYLTSGVDGQNTLMALSIEDGNVEWQLELGDDKGNKHRKGSGSNPSPVTDGEHVVAYYRSGDLACVSADGRKQWHINLQKEFGEDTLWWDLGSSPLLVDGMVVIAVMQTGPSYVVAYDMESGKQVWKTDRQLNAPEEAAQSYATPLAVTVNGESCIAVMGADHLTLHHASDGKTIGTLGGFNPNGERFFRSIASPVAAANLIVCPYARGATVTVVDMEQLAAGAVTEAIVWFRDDLGSDVPTPTIHGDTVIFVEDGKPAKGSVIGVSIQTGETQWTVEQPRSRHGYSSSPLVADDRVYVTGEDGRVCVIGPLSSANPELLATNDLDDDDLYTVASPVPVDGGFLLRTRHFLYRINAR
ncbi:MAG: PQQ-binding-like beta-propeller repeat protein [Planctomycetota bacterium]